MRNGTAGMRHQKMQSIEFSRCQVYFDAESFDAAADRIEHDCAMLDGHLGGGFRCAKSTDSCANSGSQLAYLEWLGDIIVCTDFQCFNFVILIVAHGQHKDWQAREGATDAPTCFDASHPRHVDVEEYSLAFDCSQLH